MPNLSITALYNWDETIFDDMILPEEIADKKQIVIDNILLKCGELECLYADSDFMKKAIGIWSRAEARTWEKQARVVYKEYDPLWNVDAETYEKEKRDLKSTGNNTATDTGSVKGFNSDTWADHDKSTAGTESEATDTGTIERWTKRHGNIGVTMAQRMLEREWEVASFNIINEIASSFQNRFCLLIY